MRFVSLISAIVLAHLTIGCSSIVKKPDIQEVKKVAILSIFANDMVPEKKGRGFVKGWKDDFKMEVAEEFQRVHAAHLRKMGWKVLESEKVLSSKAYREKFEIKPMTKNKTANRVLAFVGGLAKDSHQAKFFSPAGMIAIPIQESAGSCFGSDCPEPFEPPMAEMAKKLGVDAVVLIGIDFCYEGGTFTSLGGAGEAFMSAATTVKMVNRSGDRVIDMPLVSFCGKSDNRAESENSMLMNGGDLVLISASGEKLRRLFKQAAANSAKLAYGQISEAM